MCVKLENDVLRLLEDLRTLSGLDWSRALVTGHRLDGGPGTTLEGVS